VTVQQQVGQQMLLVAPARSLQQCQQVVLVV
jgi:hypothetical protein